MTLADQRVGIVALEYHLPAKVETGQALKSDNPDWRMEDIEAKTGVRQRHIAALDETAADLAAQAAEKIFSQGVPRESVESLIFVTQSPDYALPTTACLLQNRLGLPLSCMSFDVNLGCSGFIYGLAIASSLIRSGVVRNSLLLCGDTYTKWIDKADRTCRPIFGDGAAATLLSVSPKGGMGPFVLGTDGSGAESFIVRNSGARIEPERSSADHKIRMQGPHVFLFTMDMVPKCVESLLQKSGKTLDQIDLFIFHQASRIVLENIERRLSLPPEKVYSNLSRVGNTVSASIPMALKDAAAEGRLREGDTVMLVGFGVGYSWGACLVQWGPL
ncbi:MAG: ketoacyl-ACP synthase III [Elusimicrobiota bacterium]|jgi:3-oxoacyl-[acyl-carrier-protein] synthase-3